MADRHAPQSHAPQSHSHATLDARAEPFRTHMRRTLVLGLPLVGAQLAQMLINTTDTVMLGWLGTVELAAGTLATQFFFVFFIVGIGFAAAMTPMIASALGRAEEAAHVETADEVPDDALRPVRRATRMGLWVLLIVSALFMIPMLFVEPILTAFGQPPEVIALAADYLIIAQWSLFPALLVMGLRQFLTALERAQAVLWITVATALMNGLLNWAFIFGNWGAPRLEIRGAAVATIGANIAALLLVVAYIAWTPALARFRLFVRLWRPDWTAFAEVARLGWPIGLALLAEAGLFAVSSLMMGAIGTLPLAAHGIALQLASLAFMIPLGLSTAATVRVGNALGRDRPLDVARAGWAAFLCALAFAGVSALLFVTVPEELSALFLRDNPDAASVVAVAVPLLAMAAAFQLADAGQVVGAGVLRGLKDTRVPMLIAVAAYWGLGVPAAWFLGLHMGFGGPGVWGGLVVGLTVAAVALAWRFHRLERFNLGSSRSGGEEPPGAYAPPFAKREASHGSEGRSPTAACPGRDPG